MSRLKDPQEHDDFLNYRIKRLLGLGGAPAIRLCEGRFGVARMEWRLLAALKEDGPMSLSALVGRTGIDQARVSRGVEKLREKGLVHRTRDASDRRRAVLAPTEQGLQLYRELFPELAQINRRIMSVLDEAEALALESYLQRLTDQAHRILASGGGVDVRTDRRLGGARRHQPSDVSSSIISTKPTISPPVAKRS
jgi:DNA-binding MarR family transcriptional regulator